MTVHHAATCPRCQAPLPTAEPGQELLVCSECGLPISTEYLAEYQQLQAWQASAAERLAWLHGRLMSGDVPALTALGSASGGVPAPGPERPPHHRASAGSLLLAVGAFLLVAAGIAFIAFTWDLLGPFGQIAVLLALGAGCLWSSHRLAVTLRGTAVAIGVVGGLLVSIAALGARFLGPDIIGDLAALVVAVVILAGLVAAGVWIRPRTAGVGELCGTVGALLAVVLVALAPADDAVPVPDPWAWWSALWLLAGAALLLAFADRVRMRSWPWTGAFLAVIGSLALATWATDVVSRASDVGAEQLVFGAVTAASALLVAVVLQRLTTHHAPVLSAVLITWSIAIAVTWVAAVDPRGLRGWSALVLFGVGAVALVPALLGGAPRVLRAVVLAGAAVTMASAVGVAIPPYVEARIELQPLAWAGDAWPPWRGAVAGASFVVVLVVTAWVATRLANRLEYAQLVHLLPFATTGAALVTWLIATQADLVQVTTPRRPYGYEPEPTPEAVLRQVAVALVVLAAGVLVMALLRRLPAWSTWLVPALGVPAVLLVSSTVTVDSPLAPELLGVALALPALVTAVSWWWLRRPEAPATWQTITPPFVLAVLPSTLALIGDASGRWWYDEDPGAEYQVRTVVLIAVALSAAVVGARQRWSGLFFPGLALALVIVAVELVDLGRFLPQWVSFGLAGAALVAAGARWEWLRSRGKEGAVWVRSLR